MDYMHMVEKYGGDILASDGMQSEKQFMQHGSVSTYEHSLSVAVMCLRLSHHFHIHVNVRSLVRGTLLHDYYLYDWHTPHSGHDLHAVMHAKYALKNASRDFTLNEVERDMIAHHMFPLNPMPPRYRESVILCVADKLCALSETVTRSGHNGNNSDA